jgi:hypothetical protein
VAIGGKRAIKIIKALYSDCTTVLDRKHKKAIEILERIDKRMLTKLYEIFQKYRDIFHERC